MKADCLAAWSVVLVAAFLPGCFDGEEGYLEVTPDAITIEASADGLWPPARMVTISSSPGDRGVGVRPADSAVRFDPFPLPSVVMLSCDPTGVAPGTYENELLVTLADVSWPSGWSGEATASVTVNVFHEPGQPFPGFAFKDPPLLNAHYFYFSVEEGTSGVATQSLGLVNQGGGTLDWTLTTDRDWLSVEPAGGDTTDEEDLVTVEVDATGLTADLQHDWHDYSYYYGTITAATNSPSLPEETIQVILYVYDDSGGSMRSVSRNSR